MTHASQVDALSVLSERPTVDADLLAIAICDTTALIEPWYKATSDYAPVKDIILQVQNIGDVFYSAIDVSREAAMNGIRLSQDLSTFFVYIQNKKTGADELRELIYGMMKVAARARGHAQRVSELFSSTRREIYMVTNRIPTEVSALAQEEEQNIKRLATAKKEIRNLKVAKACAAAGAAVVAGVSIVAFPPALLFLPVVLPLLSLVFEAREIHVAKKNEKREKKIYQVREAIALLERTAEGLEKLGTFNDAFAEYWSRVETNLEIIVDRIDELRSVGFRGLGLSTIRRSCEEIGKSQLDYSTKLKRLELYAPRRLNTSPSISSTEVAPHADIPLPLSPSSELGWSLIST
ncbi:hypothetical protein FPV67DRAFT_1667467 [Lyophyllum atratum]|nr:hypothetical protein FPV67DRAFT_1667467 [Lyophyllum atratum]